MGQKTVQERPTAAIHGLALLLTVSPNPKICLARFSATNMYPHSKHVPDALSLSTSSPCRCPPQVRAMLSVYDALQSWLALAMVHARSSCCCWLMIGHRLLLALALYCARARRVVRPSCESKTARARDCVAHSHLSRARQGCTHLSLATGLLAHRANHTLCLGCGLRTHARCGHSRALSFSASACGDIREKRAALWRVSFLAWPCLP